MGPTTDLYAAIRDDIAHAVHQIKGSDPDSFDALTVDRLAAALRAALDQHEPTYSGDEVEYEDRDEPAYDRHGKFFGYITVRGDPVRPYWCARCGEMTPCEEVRVIAEKLEIET